MTIRLSGRMRSTVALAGALALVAALGACSGGKSSSSSGGGSGSKDTVTVALRTPNWILPISAPGFTQGENAIFTHGGMGYAKEYHVERYLREAWIPRLAPVSPQLILCFIAEKVLGLPKSY